MSTTIESESISTDDFEVGDVVIVSRSITEDDDRTFATVVVMGRHIQLEVTDTDR